MTVGWSSRIQNRSIRYQTIARIPEKAPMRHKSRSCLVSTDCICLFIFFFCYSIILRERCEIAKPGTAPNT